MSLRVLQIGADAAWWGAATSGLRKFGVPESGPFDRESWTWCCALAETEHAIEIGPFGAILVAESDLSFAVIGAQRELRIDDREISNGRYVIRAGQTLMMGRPILGARSYLAPYQATIPAQTGLLPRLVKRGDLLGGSLALPLRSERPPLSVSDMPVKIVLGPQAGLFEPDALTGSLWTVGLAADRSGIRLEGPAFTPKEPWGDRPSEPHVFGVIQITSGGTPVIIGPDGPTIGGYPKAAVVIEADLDRLGQVKPGDTIRFEWTDLDVARALRREYQARLRPALLRRS